MWLALMNSQPKGQSTSGTRGQYNSSRLRAVGSEDNWRPLINTAIAGGGGGNDMDRRVTVLETHIEHIQTDIGTIKDDSRHSTSIISNEISGLRNMAIGAAVIIIGAIGTLYLYVHDKTDGLGKEISSVEGDIKNVSTQIVNLQTTMDKFVTVAVPAQEKK